MYIYYDFSPENYDKLLTEVYFCSKYSHFRCFKNGYSVYIINSFGFLDENRLFHNKIIMTGQKHKMPCHIKKERKFYIFYDCIRSRFLLMNDGCRLRVLSFCCSIDVFLFFDCISSLFLLMNEECGFGMLNHCCLSRNIYPQKGKRRHHIDAVLIFITFSEAPVNIIQAL